MSTSHHMAASLVRGVDRALVVAGAIGLIAMMLHVGIDILSSRLFNAPLAITSAIVTNYYMIAVAFLPIMVAEYRGAHIGVSLITDALPQGARRSLDLVVSIVMIVVYVLLTLQAWREATDKYAAGAFLVEQTTRILVWPAYFIIPASFGAMTLFLVLKLVLRAAGQEIPPAPEVETGPVQNEAKNV